LTFKTGKAISQWYSVYTAATGLFKSTGSANKSELFEPVRHLVALLGTRQRVIIEKWPNGSSRLAIQAVILFLKPSILWRCTLVPLMSSNPYGGIDRRGNFERRSGADRRNLVRYEAIGSDRRLTQHRRAEDAVWSSKMPQY